MKIIYKLDFVVDFFKHELIKGSLWLLVGAILSSLLTFLSNLFLARNLSIIDYGIYASLLSLFTLSTIPAASVNNVIVKFAGRYFAQKKHEYASRFYKKLIYTFTFASAFILAIFAILGQSISSFLHMDESPLLMIIAVAIALNYIGSINHSYLTSLYKFSFLTFSTITSSFIRLIVAIVLVFSGVKLYGAVLSVLASILTSFFLKFIPLRFLFRSNNRKNVKIQKMEIIRYALPSSIAILSLSSLVSMDVILSRHFLSEHDAGLYGGLSLLGKIILYATSSVGAVMFPIIVRKNEKNESFLRIFYLALTLIAMASFGIALFYLIFPELTISFFLNRGAYLEVAHLLWLFGLFGAVWSLLQIFVTFFLSIKKTNIVYLAGAGAILQIILINIFHGSITEIVYSSLMTSVLLLGCLLIYYYNWFRLMNNRKINTSGLTQLPMNDG